MIAGLTETGDQRPDYCIVMHEHIMCEMELLMYYYNNALWYKDGCISFASDNTIRS